jgi:peroxiredoxin
LGLILQTEFLSAEADPAFFQLFPPIFVGTIKCTMSVTVGQPAPDFSLFDSEKKKLTLSELKGKNVLLLFFPFAFTSTCTEELCSVRDTMKQYESLDLQPIGISVDSLYTLARYKEDQQLNFPLLSDFNKEVSNLYDTIYEKFGFEMRGVSKRSAFLIDKKGIVQYAEVLENAGLQPDFSAIQVKLRELAG